MEGAVVAYVGSGLTVLAAAVAGWFALLASRHASRAQTDLELLRSKHGLAATQEQRAADAAATLDRYRLPLLEAAEDLRHRVDNIRRSGFLWYVREGGLRRRDLALKGSLYRVAKYFGWVAAVEHDIARLRFASSTETKAVALAMAEIGRAFASDSLDVSQDGRSRMMLWREEQRAVGELMLSSLRPAAVLGFSEFVAAYDERFSPWLEPLSQDLASPDAPASERLRRIQDALSVLVTQLDEDEIFVKQPWADSGTGVAPQAALPDG